MKVLVPKVRISGAFLHWFLKVCQPRLLDMVATVAHGTNGLESDDLARFVVSVPPMPKTIGFMADVGDVVAIQACRATPSARAQANLDALLGQCFAPA